MAPPRERVVAGAADEHGLGDVSPAASSTSEPLPLTCTTLSKPVSCAMSTSPSMSRSTAGPTARPPVWFWTPT